MSWKSSLETWKQLDGTLHCSEAVAAGVSTASSLLRDSFDIARCVCTKNWRQTLEHMKSIEIQFLLCVHFAFRDAGLMGFLKSWILSQSEPDLFSFIPWMSFIDPWLHKLPWLALVTLRPAFAKLLQEFFVPVLAHEFPWCRHPHWRRSKRCAWQGALDTTFRCNAFDVTNVCMD